MVVWLLAGDDTVHLGKGVVGNRLVDAQGISLGIPYFILVWIRIT